MLVGTATPSHDGLTEVRLDESDASVLSTDSVHGRVNAVVYPWDVSLAREAPRDSALNHLSEEIVTVVRVGNRARVRLRTLTAEVTAASADRLSLAPRVHVVASFKATATRLVPRR